MPPPKRTHPSLQKPTPQHDRRPPVYTQILHHLDGRDLADFTAALSDDIKPVPFTVLCLIQESPGITAAEIGRQLQLQRANLAPMLGELDARGLLERRTDREDHRVQRLHLTESGAAALAGWQARNLRQEEETFAALTAEERETFVRLLAKVWTA